jgi:hypothetical protein
MSRNSEVSVLQMKSRDEWAMGLGPSTSWAACGRHDVCGCGGLNLNLVFKYKMF